MVYFHGHLGNKYYIYGVVESISFKVAVLSAWFVCLSVLVTRITQRSGSELRGPRYLQGMIRSLDLVEICGLINT